MRVERRFTSRQLVDKMMVKNRVHGMYGINLLKSTGYVMHQQFKIQRLYVVGSKSFRPDIQKPRQMENVVRDI